MVLISAFLGFLMVFSTQASPEPPPHTTDIPASPPVKTCVAEHGDVPELSCKEPVCQNPRTNNVDSWTECDIPKCQPTGFQHKKGAKVNLVCWEKVMYKQDLSSHYGYWLKSDRGGWIQPGYFVGCFDNITKEMTRCPLPGRAQPCWHGFARTNFRAIYEPPACGQPHVCTPIKDKKLLQKLYSARADDQVVVDLFYSGDCSGESIQIDATGYWNLSKVRAFNSFKARYV